MHSNKKTKKKLQVKYILKIIKSLLSFFRMLFPLTFTTLAELVANHPLGLFKTYDKEKTKSNM